MTRSKLLLVAPASIAGFIVSIAFAATPALAGVGGSVVPGFPTPMSVGDIKTATVAITNHATTPNNSENINVSNIFITPSCAATDGVSCTSPDPSVFQFATAIGKAGTSCASTPFTLGPVNPQTGEFQLIPPANKPVVLGPSNGAGPLTNQCLITINFKVLKAPKDSTPLDTPVTTDYFARATLQGATSGLIGTGSGIGTVAINVPPSTASCTLAATPSSVTPGAYFTLSWSSTNATSFSLNGVSTPLSGAMSIAVGTTTAYMGTATNATGSATCSTTVTVTPPKPVWTKDACLADMWGCLPNSYTPVVQLDATHIRVYSNLNYATGVDGDLWMQTGTWTSLGTPTEVIAHTQVNDLPPNAAGVPSTDPFIRTTAVVRGASGQYYALLHVGNSYPSDIGFLPAWATSADGVTWQYKGLLTIDGAHPYVYASSAALVVQEDKPATLDTVNPANNRYLVWEDSYSINGVGKHLVLVYSNDAVNWHFWRDASGNVIDVWPTDPSVANDGPVFPTVARVPGGYRLIAANAYPATAHRDLWSCDGLHWSVLDANSPTLTAAKGTNLVYDAFNNLLHALTFGSHFQMPIATYTCP